MNSLRMQSQPAKETGEKAETTKFQKLENLLD